LLFNIKKHDALMLILYLVRREVKVWGSGWYLTYLVLCSGGNLGFSILPRDTLKCGLEEKEIKPLSF